MIPGRNRLRPYLAVAVLMLSAGQVDAAGVVFRYLPGSAELSSKVETRHVETGPFLDPWEHQARWPGGWGYDPIWAAEFEGASSTMWGGISADVNQPAGPRMTAEVWLRLLERDTHHTLLSNRIGSLDGFTLGLEAGLPYFMMVVGGVAYRIVGSEEIVTGQDVWIAATAEYMFSNMLILRIYRDGKLVAEESISVTIASPYAIPRPFFVGTEAAGTEGNLSLKGTITGLLFAAIVRDYVAHPSYLGTPPPFDGSAYFGMPAFHDYELGSFHLPMDQRIDTYSTPVTHRFFLPHVNDAFIPQGTAVVSDEAGQAKLVYVSYYHRTRNNRLATRRSIVVEIDVATGHVRRTFRLNGQLRTAHVGGVAVVGEAIYVASEGTVERYILPPYEEAGDRYIDLLADSHGTRNVRSKASFVSSFQDTLWVGDYRTGGQQQPYLYGYPLDEAGLIVQGASPVIYPIPRRIQGVDFHAVDNTVYVFMARNRNSREAEVLRFKRADLLPDTLPAWEASITFPHGIEDLAFSPDGTLWTNSESGTDYYQRTAGWSTFYPFVYGVALSEILLHAGDTQPDQVPLPDLHLEVFPNPAADQLHINYVLDQPSTVHLQVFDLLGREVKAVVYPPQRPGAHHVTWMIDHLASGAYMLVLEAEEYRVHQPITLLQ